MSVRFWRLGAEDQFAHSIADAQVATIGVFDGLHKGHRALISSAVSDGPTVVFTLHPSPVEVLHNRRHGYLQTLAQRCESIMELGATHCVVIDFSRHFATLTGTEFIDRILRMMHPRVLWLGYDFKFGAGAAETAEHLRRSESRFAVRIAPALRDGQVPVSSTRVRVAVQEGRLTDASLMLGRDFALDLRTLDAAGDSAYNIEKSVQVLPPEGVYDVTLVPQQRRARARLTSTQLWLTDAVFSGTEQVVFRSRTDND